MAVYKKTYQRYEGALTPEWSRLFVLTRYTFEEMRRSKFPTIFFLATMIVPLGFAFTIYARHNLAALTFFRIDAANLNFINTSFFLNFLGVQSMLAFFCAAFVGPGLISPDLANNALPLYLARPFSRYEYILGRMSVLLILLSAMTWIPGLLMFGLQSYLDDTGWMQDNMRIAYGLFVGSCVWILVLSCLALAISAWVKWKPVAGAMMFGVFFVGAGFGAFINGVLRTNWGTLLNIGSLMGTVWLSLFEQPMMRRGAGGAFFRIRSGWQVPDWSAWLMLALICGGCLYLLAKKIRGAEVVK